MTTPHEDIDFTIYSAFGHLGLAHVDFESSSSPLDAGGEIGDFWVHVDEVHGDPRFSAFGEFQYLKGRP